MVKQSLNKTLTRHARRPKARYISVSHLMRLYCLTESLGDELLPGIFFFKGAALRMQV